MVGMIDRGELCGFGRRRPEAAGNASQKQTANV